LLTGEIEKKGNRITFLQNTELVGIEAKLIAWEVQATNSIQDSQEEIFKQYKQKYKSQKKKEN
jgi:hypothetical protein